MYLLNGWVGFKKEVKRMDKVLNLQVSFFGSFRNIRLETEIVIDLLTALKDDGFVPGSVDIASVDLKTGNMNVDSRIQMISPDKTWVIVFLPDRIDFNYNYQIGTTEHKHIDNLLVYIKKLVEKVFSVFKSTIGNRLALNCKLVLENMTEDDLKQFCGRFTNPLSAYNGDSYAEWSVLFNARGRFRISEVETEECNRITEMTQVEDQNGLIDETNISHSIILSMDVNTIPSNNVQRFKYNHLLCFANDVAQFVNEVMKEIEGNY